MASYKKHPRYKELYQRGNLWWMFVPNPLGGKALRESTKHSDAEAAHRVYLERIRTAPEVKGSGKKARSLEAALLARVEWLELNQDSNDPSRKKLSKASIDFYTKKSLVLVSVFGADTPLSEVTTPESIRQYIVKRTKAGTKGTTISKELTALSMAVKMAHKDGVECQLVRDLKPDDFKSVYVPRERWLTSEEYDRFMRWWYANRSSAKGAVLDFLVSTGATYPSEVCHGQEDDANPKTFEIHLRGTKREARDRRFIVPSDRRSYFARALKHRFDADSGPVPGDGLFHDWGANIRRDIHIACAYLSMCKDCEKSKRLFWRNVDTNTFVQSTSQRSGTPTRDPKCKACAKVEVFEPFCPTDLRRTFAQWLVQSGVPYEAAYPMMGHTDDRMLKLVYGKRSAMDVAPMVESALRAFAKRGGKVVNLDAARARRAGRAA